MAEILRVYSFPIFESNHCGIETFLFSFRAAHREIFESNHCGIETLQSILLLNKSFTLNRTIVGLKHIITFSIKSSIRDFESNHCGIETEIEIGYQ